MRTLLALVLILVTTLVAVACVRQVEDSGRTQLAIYSDDQMNKLGTDAYAQIIAEEKRSTDAEAIALVERVGKRLVAVAPDRGFAYEFTVLESDAVNAFCLPGGKVAVYTGILGLCENEAGLAAVLGHEIAHAIADHGNERMSQGVLVSGATQALGAYLQGKGVEPSTLNMGMTAFGMGAQLGVILPFSRKHELEADALGLEYMAKAGYDPAEAVSFWQRFAKLGEGGQPSWMSTHPQSGDRAQALQARMAQATAWYDGAGKRFGAGAQVPKRYRKTK